MSENYYAMTRLLARKQLEAVVEAERDHAGRSVAVDTRRLRPLVHGLSRLIRLPFGSNSVARRRRLAQG